MKGGPALEQLFGLNPQLLHDTVLSILAILFLFALMSYLLFNPAKKMLKDRQERIKNDIDTARKDKEEASAVKAEYYQNLKCIEKEEEEILSEARQKALKNQTKTESRSLLHPEYDARTALLVLA